MSTPAIPRSQSYDRYPQLSIRDACHLPNLGLGWGMPARTHAASRRRTSPQHVLSPSRVAAKRAAQPVYETRRTPPVSCTDLETGYGRRSVGASRPGRIGTTTERLRDRPRDAPTAWSTVDEPIVDHQWDQD
jgi:hypothetical protein